MAHGADSMSSATRYSRRAAMKFVVLLGIVSLFADMTYEGARSVTGPYLAILGASGLAVGLIAGFGELVGYALAARLGLSRRQDRQILGDHDSGLRAESPLRAAPCTRRAVGVCRGADDHRAHRQGHSHARP